MNLFEFADAAFANPINVAIIERLPRLHLADCWLVSGALFQTVWNRLTNRPVDHGIRDYDVFYFDTDLAWEAEDMVIKQASTLFADLNVAVEVRNQARVHLWYEEKFGTTYPPLACSTDGIDRFLMHNAMVGIRGDDSACDVYAPKGFADILSMTVRPNLAPNFHPVRYREKAERWREHWPELTILAP